MHPDQPAELRPLMVDSDDDELSDTEAALPSPQQQQQQSPSPPAGTTTNRSWRQQNQWVVLALVSGACAAFNGVFAKLTTTELTSRLSLGLAHALGLAHVATAVELVVRAIFFGLNLAFNGLMWTVFTKALARGHSATQVSVMNTSANFVLTALLGLVIFSEALPPLWWLGAALLVAGNVIIGRKDEAAGDPASQVVDEELLADLHTAATSPDATAAASGSGPTATTRHRVPAGINGSTSSSSLTPSAGSTIVPGNKKNGTREQDEDVLDLDVSHI